MAPAMISTAVSSLSEMHKKQGLACERRGADSEAEIISTATVSTENYLDPPIAVSRRRQERCDHRESPGPPFTACLLVREPDEHPFTSRRSTTTSNRTGDRLSDGAPFFM